jgi:signal transduction histidine kinase
LSLSKALAELHGGTLKVSSELDKGTTVTVAFGHERTKYSSESNAAGDSS